MPRGDGLEDWEQLYLAHYASTARLAGFLLGDFDAGEDVAQEAMARLLLVRREVTDPPAYLRRTTVNLSRSRLRRAVVASRYRPTASFVAASPDDAVDGWAAHSVLMRELRRLPTRQREAVVLRFYGQMSEVEVAAAMKVSVGSVKTHLSRAMRSLRAQIEELR